MSSPDVDYFFCRNVECSFHASFQVGQVPADSGLAVGSPCPICRVGEIDRIRLNNVRTLPRAVGVVPTARVLPGMPYGGMVLQRGDADNSQTWGGVVVSDPRHDGAQYVAELQRDLLRLAYYGPARGGETVGVFGLQLMACVLNIKQHLVAHYGVAANVDFAQVQAGARAEGAAVHFPPGGLVSPADALKSVRGWSRHLGTSARDVPLLRSIRDWARGWERLQSARTPTVAELAALREQSRNDSTLQTSLSGRLPAADRAGQTFSGRMARLEHPHSQGTLTEEAVAQAEADFDVLIAALGEIGGPLPELLRRVRELDGRLPGRAPMQDPGDTEVTLVARAPTEATLEARYQRLLDGRRRESSVRTNQRAALNFARGKLGTFDRRMDQVGREWSTQDKAAALVRDSAQMIVDEAESAVAGAALLNAQPASGRAAVPEELRNARTYLPVWLGTTTGSAPGPAGSLEQLQTAMAGIESDWSTAGILPPDPGWSEAKGLLQACRPHLQRFHEGTLHPNAEMWDSAYLALLRDFGRIDHATARYVRGMVTHGELRGRKVFLTPQDDEVVPLQGTLNDALPRLVDDVLHRMRRPAGDGPLPILRFIYRHESGAKHVGAFAGRNFVKLGIDWPNPQTSNAFFDERLTPARVLSTSRGWGATQFTLFNTARHRTLRNESGNPVSYEIIAGIPFATASNPGRPLPLLIQSAEENIRQGTELFLRGFGGARRECSFRPGGAAVSDRSYECIGCARRLRTGPSRLAGGGVRTYDDAQGDFERLPGAAGPLFKLRQMTRLRELLRSGFFRLADARTAEQATEADLLEFPCSWLACVIRYASVSRRGFDYMLEAIETMSNS